MTRWSVPASLAVHVALLAMLVLVPLPEVAPERPIRSIAVEIFSERAAPVATGGPGSVPQTAEPLAEALPPAPPAAPAPADDDDGMIAADTFYASAVLSDPANAEIRATLPLLATDQQIVELCNIEALEQVNAHDAEMSADALVGYAFADMTIVGDVLAADGGALRSTGEWYRFRFECEIGADARSVTRFEYAVGAIVPHSEWDRHDLNANDDWLD